MSKFSDVAIDFICDLTNQLMNEAIKEFTMQKKMKLAPEHGAKPITTAQLEEGIRKSRVTLGFLGEATLIQHLGREWVPIEPEPVRVKRGDTIIYDDQHGVKYEGVVVNRCSDYVLEVCRTLIVEARASWVKHGLTCYRCKKNGAFVNVKTKGGRRVMGVE